MNEEEWKAGSAQAMGLEPEDMPANKQKNHVHTWVYSPRCMEYWCSSCLKTKEI